MHQGRKRNKCQEKKENARRKSSNPRNQSWRFSVRGLRKLCASQVYRLLSPWFHTQRREGDRKHEDDRVPRGTMAATKLFPNSLPNFLSPLWCICNSPTRFPPFPCFFFFPVLYSFHQATRLRIGFHPDGFVASFFPFFLVLFSFRWEPGPILQVVPAAILLSTQWTGATDNQPFDFSSLAELSVQEE